MHGLSLSQRSVTPCCASPPTAPHRQADTHTYAHTLHLVIAVIYSTLALSPTLSVCSQTATQMSERERQGGRPGVGGVWRLKLKDKDRENSESEVYIHAETVHLHDYTVWTYVCALLIYLGFSVLYVKCGLLSITKLNPLWVQQAGCIWTHITLYKHLFSLLPLPYKAVIRSPLNHSHCHS